ncbi:MAG TPA: LuxR C-terminal-related transcriptional regulator [Actinospica sp.]|nr:LuxR C-terminal-related transcriptional regulator [Actinospica sp.]
MDSVALWPLTARAGQLEKFARVWASPRYRAVVVGGAAGVGKTRLAEEFAARATLGGTVLIGRATASSAAAAVPLGALAHLLPPGNHMADPVNAFARVASVIRAEGRGRAAGVLVDDLHLLDTVSAMLLRQLLDAGAVRLIATLRTDLPRAEAISALITGDSVHRIDLPAFTLEQSAAVVAAALGGAVARAAVHELHTGSGGNALYLRELVLGGVKDGTLGWDGELWRRTADAAPSAGTPRLAELIEARFAELRPAELTVLELLAVAAPVSLAEAQAACGDPAALTELELAGLIQIIEDRRRTVVLPAHPVYTELLRARIPVLRRRALLTAQADRIAATGARRREDALRIAVCRLGATGAADPALLAEAAVLARHAYDYPQARTMLEAMPSAAHTSATLVMLGEVFCQLGEVARAQSVFDDAQARAVGDREILAVALARSFGLYWLGAQADRAFEVVDAARARVRDEGCLRMLRYCEGSMRIASGELARGLALLEDMEPDVRSALDSTTWLTAAMMRAMALGLTGRTDLEVELGERQHAAHRELRDQPGYLHPATQLIQLGLALCRNGDINRAREVAERAHAELIAGASTSHALVWVSLALGDIESQAGHCAAARTWFAEAVALARARRLSTPLNPALAGLAVSAAALGDLGAAEQAAAEAGTHPPLGLCNASGYLLPARLAAARGDLEQARALLSRGADAAASAGMAGVEAALLTEIARFGDPERVAPRLAQLTELCDSRFTPARARFAAALAADDPAELLGAATDLELIGAELLAAEAATAAAAAYTRAADARRATAASQKARALLDHCGPARTPLLAAGQATATLTVRERDIALAAARGASSQEIAEQLSLSVRTVENHLYRAYAKLGVTSRRELAATLAPESSRNP